MSLEKMMGKITCSSPGKGGQGANSRASQGEAGASRRRSGV